MHQLKLILRCAIIMVCEFFDKRDFGVLPYVKTKVYVLQSLDSVASGTDRWKWSCQFRSELRSVALSMALCRYVSLSIIFEADSLLLCNLQKRIENTRLAIGCSGLHSMCS